MSFRELVILLLGLAIVGVILRGLYVALQARRGQIKLAIDKNIPRDVDLDALEMAELPSGGARVVSRGENQDEAELSHDDPIERANARAESIALDREAEAVPVLMDSVSLAHDKAEQVQADPIPSDFYEDDVETASVLAPETDEEEFDLEEVEDRSTPALGEFDNDEFDGSHEDETEEVIEADTEQLADSSAEDVLLDYQADTDDGLASVQPDYPEDDVTDETDEDYDGFEGSADEVIEEEDFEEDDYYREESAVEDNELEQTAESQQRSEPAFDPAAVADGLDDFSMTAGERIGGHRSARTDLGQPELFDEDSEEAEVPSKRSSLFGAIRDKISQTLAGSRAEQSDESEDVVEEEEYDYDFDSDIDEEVEEVSEEVDAEGYQESYEEQTEFELPDVEENVEENLVAAAPEPTDIRQHQTTAQPTEIRQQAPAAQPSEVIVMNVMAREGQEFSGDDLLHAVITNGLKFGEMNIFHQRFGNDSKGPVIFSLANILNPGTFDLNTMSEFTTIGVSLFLAMPAPGNNFEAFEHMLEVAQHLCDSLDGELKDDHRNMMTAQTIEHYRQRVRDFELRQLKAAGSRG